mgnify:FL=1
MDHLNDMNRYYILPRMVQISDKNKLIWIPVSEVTSEMRIIDFTDNPNDIRDELIDINNYVLPPWDWEDTQSPIQNTDTIKQNGSWTKPSQE